MRQDLKAATSSSPNRRRFLLSAAAAAAAPLVGCGGGGGGGGAFVPAATSASTEGPVVITTSGQFKGQTSGAVLRYLGVPYAQAPVGALRFAAPRPYQASRDVVDATAFGPASLQTIPPNTSWIYPTPTAQSEDCLTLNVWTPGVNAKAPVIVFLHGGGFRTGATSMPLMDGQHLCERGIVVVTVNYRLGALGLLSHPDFADSTNGSMANWQQQDMAAALQWVRQNIASFGGDPNNVCLMGQSGGAMSAAIFAQNPDVRPTFQKVILLSPPTVIPPSSMTLTDAAAYTKILADKLGTTPRGLRDADAKTLHSAEIALNTLPLPAGFTSGFGFKLTPMVDGHIYRADWTRTAWPADLPVMITYTHDEGAFFQDLVDPASDARLTPPLPTSTSALTAAVIPQAGGPANAAAVIAAYTQAALNEGRSTDPGDLWIDIFGDRLLRNYGTRYAKQISSAGANVRYGTYMHSVKAPGRGVPHCADLPLIFGTYGLDYYKDKVGAGAAEAQLAGNLATAIISFARDASDVRFDSGIAWPRLDAGMSMSALVGSENSGDVSVGSVPKLVQMGVWDSLLGY
jgi:para-nitrobenzyl esterase